MNESSSAAGTSLARETALSFLFWTFFALLDLVQTDWSVRSHGHSALKLAAYVLFTWYGWAALTPLVSRIGRYAPIIPFTWKSAAIHSLAALTLASIHIFYWVSLSVGIRPYGKMGTIQLFPYLPYAWADRICTELLIYIAVLGILYAVEYYGRYRERDLRAANLETSLARAQLHALELQMQPHFLFNTLHAISGLVRQSRNPEAVEMVAGLSDLLRYSLEHAGNEMVPLEREMAILTRYLDIQKLRFSDRLTVRVCMAQEVKRAAVPALILQPLAENAVRHGIEPSAAPGTIEVRARRQDDRLRIDIFNSGPRLEVSREGIGLRNTGERLRALYGEEQSLELRNEGNGVLATIFLPMQEAV